MRAAGLLMMVIGAVLLAAPIAVVFLLGWTRFLAQGSAMVGLYGLLMVMGLALVEVGRRTARERP